MYQHESRSITLGDVVCVLRRYWARWMVPAAIIAGAVFCFALLKPPVWEVSQAVMVRNEANSRREMPGKFHLDDEMKTTQETILQVASSRGVLDAALVQAGPSPTDPAPTAWPTKEALEGLRSALAITPPTGTDFGATEVFYLKVKDTDAQRATDLVTAVYDQLSTKLSELRDQRAQSMLAELSKNVELARADLDKATRELTETERAAGEGLVELRMLHQAPSGNGDINRPLVESQNELRRLELAQRVNQELLDLLQQAHAKPELLLSAPPQVTEARPNLVRLREGLNAAQIRTAELRGRLTDAHPEMQAAVRAEVAIRDTVCEELSDAIRAIEGEVQISDGRREALTAQITQLQGRMAKLGDLRATYSRLVNHVEHLRQVLEAADNDLAAVRATQAAARGTSLISRSDLPDVGTRPIGPGRAMITLIGIVGGLTFGFAVVLLTVRDPFGHSTAAASRSYDFFDDPPMRNGKGNIDYDEPVLAR